MKGVNLSPSNLAYCKWFFP